MIVIHFIGADVPSIGRINYALLSSQTLMEIFVENIENVGELFKDKNGNFKDIEDWEGLRVNDDSEVIVIDFFENLHEGTLNFEAIPATVLKVSIGMVYATGEVPWGKLSDRIRYFSLFDSDFQGSVDLTALPHDLYSLSLENVKFTGTLNFSQLPKNLIVLDLSGNSFDGQVDLRPIEKEIGDCRDEHFNIRWDMLVPHEDMPFGINLSRNSFDGDIMVRDIDICRDNGQFQQLKSMFMVDEKGERRKLKQRFVF